MRDHDTSGGAFAERGDDVFVREPVKTVALHQRIDRTGERDAVRNFRHPVVECSIEAQDLRRGRESRCSGSHEIELPSKVQAVKRQVLLELGQKLCVHKRGQRVIGSAEHDPVPDRRWCFNACRVARFDDALEDGMRIGRIAWHIAGRPTACGVFNPEFRRRRVEIFRRTAQQARFGCIACVIDGEF